MMKRSAHLTRRTSSMARALALSVSFAVVCVTACDKRGAPSTAGPLRVDDAWARRADSGATGGVYLRLTNTDTADVVITAVTAPESPAAALHESSEHDGMVHMNPRASVRIARDSTLVMAPGGLHIMLPDLTRAVEGRDSVLVTLMLGDGRTVRAVARVRTL